MEPRSRRSFLQLSTLTLAAAVLPARAQLLSPLDKFSRDFPTAGAALLAASKVQPDPQMAAKVLTGFIVDLKAKGTEIPSGTIPKQISEINLALVDAGFYLTLQNVGTAGSPQVAFQLNSVTKIKLEQKYQELIAKLKLPTPRLYEGVRILQTSTQNTRNVAGVTFQDDKIKAPSIILFRQVIAEETRKGSPVSENIIMLNEIGGLASLQIPSKNIQAREAFGDLIMLANLEQAEFLGQIGKIGTDTIPNYDTSRRIIVLALRDLKPEEAAVKKWEPEEFRAMRVRVLSNYAAVLDHFKITNRDQYPESLIKELGGWDEIIKRSTP